MTVLASDGFFIRHAEIFSASYFGTEIMSETVKQVQGDEICVLKGCKSSRRERRLVEPRGVEPLTSTLPV